MRHFSFRAMIEWFRRLPKYQSAANKEIREWTRNGSISPPPHSYKQRVIKELSRRYRIKTLVETGTFYGDMVAALQSDFDHLYTIELSEELHRKASKRLNQFSNITCIQGDSGSELAALVAQLHAPAIFWLDGHYSAGETAKGSNDTPILDELSHVLGSPIRGHVIIVDDARLFGVDPAYPTIEKVVEFVTSKRPGLKVEVSGDSIRILPSRGIGNIA